MEFQSQGFKSQKHKENQQVSSFDLLSVAFSMVVIVSLSFTIFTKTLDRKKVEIAKSSMENLAQRLVKEEVIYSKKGNDRLPASATNFEVPKDPWGNEYNYQVVRNSYGQPIYLVLVSGGPDSKLDTSIQEEVPFEVSQIENIQFENDDIGYIKAFR